jgi:hypothetical protein
MCCKTDAKDWDQYEEYIFLWEYKHQYADSIANQNCNQAGAYKEAVRYEIR